MARKRMIDPGIWTNEEFGALSLLAQILFIGIISNSDDEGRLKASAKFIKATIRPYSMEDYDTITVALQEIYDTGMVVPYEADGTQYAMLPNWLKFQYIQKPTPSQIPPLPEDYVTTTLPLPPNRIEKNRIEKKGREKELPEVDNSQEAPAQLYAHPENLSLSDSKDLKLDTTKPVDRWVNAFHNHRPTAGHPFVNLSPLEIQDVKQRVQDLIDWQGEQKAVELLNGAFATHPRPTTLKQALLACSKMIEQSTPKPIDATAAYVALPVEEKLKLYHAKQAALAEKMRLK